MSDIPEQCSHDDPLYYCLKCQPARFTHAPGAAMPCATPVTLPQVPAGYDARTWALTRGCSTVPAGTLPPQCALEGEEPARPHPNGRDCEHGRRRGKCADCDLREADADAENVELRAKLALMRIAADAVTVECDEAVAARDALKTGLADTERERDGEREKLEEAAGAMLRLVGGRDLMESRAQKLVERVVALEDERDWKANNDSWRMAYNAWQDWAKDLLDELGRQPLHGSHGDGPAREVIAQLAGMAPGVPRCLDCGCFSTVHEVDDEELRGCTDCACRQFLTPDDAPVSQ